MRDVEQIVKAADAVAFILSCDPEDIEAAVIKHLRYDPAEARWKERALGYEAEMAGLRKRLAKAEGSLGRKRKERLARTDVPIEETPGYDPAQRSQSRYNRAVRKAHVRKVEWTISPVDFERLASLPCDYCGVPTGTGVGLDRLEHKGPYAVANVVPCCGKCNMVRGSRLSPEQMKIAMAAVATL